MLLQQITPSMSKKMMRKGGGASAMSGTRAPPSRRRAASCYLWRCLVKVALQLQWSLQVYSGNGNRLPTKIRRAWKPAGIRTTARMGKSSFALGWVGHTCLMKLWIAGGFNRKTWRGLGLLFEATTS